MMDRVEAANELAFRVGFSGHGGHLRVEPLYSVERGDAVNTLPDFVSPPAFVKETKESIKNHIEEKYLHPRLDTDQFSAEKAGRQWDFDWFARVKMPLEPSLPRSVVVPVWELPFRRQEKDSEKGVWEVKSVEVDVTEQMYGDQDSGILPRMVGPPKDFLRGSLNIRPFRPGGLEDSQSSERVVPDGVSDGSWVQEVLKGGPAQTVPPSFKRGLDLGDLTPYPQTWNVYKDQNLLDSVSDSNSGELSIQFDDLFNKAWEEDTFSELERDGSESPKAASEADAQTETNKINVASKETETELSVLDEILSSAKTGMLSQEEVTHSRDKQKQKEGWAITGDNEGIADRFYELVPDMAMEFPFELDRFQKEAIYYLEKGESVFVAAHTSAGKTVVAEYAFALATKHCTRAVYTAPIKTISNQKYRDFCGKFDVGLLTGDVSIRPEASCLIMTTEILRSMLYRGADIIRDIEWVIFDEVHYVNDVERGVVWEEVIIMLPRHINFVLLSATVPNTVEFADWIGRTKQKEIRVTGTTKRPVPLEHCLFYSGELYKVCENEMFIPRGVKDAKDTHKKKNSSSVTAGPKPLTGSSGHQDGNRSQKHENHSRGKQNKHSSSKHLGNSSGTWQYDGSQKNGNLRRSATSNWLLLINKLSKKSLLPVVVFCFSKNYCDKCADTLIGTDLTSSSEKSEIRVFCDKAFSRLKGSDRNLPQVLRVQSLLRRGIGVHHAGLLPIVKEVVEMLFCRGVIKVLFSTETFAMGVNAPARTVVFDALRKFDGKEFRQLLPGEYTQMAGRAGRRGLDKIGTVIIMCRDEIPDESDLRRTIVGSATRLESQFRLTYIMILHLLRVEELKVEDMLKRSFAEFHSQKKLPEKQQLLMLKRAQPIKTVECIKGEPAIEEYYEMYSEAEEYNSKISEAVMQSPHAQQFLNPGRVVVVKSEKGIDNLLGVVLKGPSSTNRQYIVLVIKPEILSREQSLVSGDKKSSELSQGYFMAPKSKRGLEDEYYSMVTSRKGSGAIKIDLPYHGNAVGVGYEVRGFDNKEFLCICHSKIKIDQVRLLEDGSKTAFSQTVQQLLDLKSDGNKYPPALDPIKDLKLKDAEVVEMYYKWASLLQKMSMNKCHGCVKLEEHMKLAREIKKHKEDLKVLEFEMSDEALKQMPDFQGRIDVLKTIGCIDDELVVQIKGRVACEMNSGEELICTEFLFENQLDDLEPEEAVAIMSAFVFQQKNTSAPSLTPKLAMAKQRLYETAIRLGELQNHYNLQIDPEEYARENLKFGLVEVVYEWAKGTAFAEICELSDVPEGLIVRTIVRLDETCREFKNAAVIMGNSALYKKMETASNSIKRDIVFAASLYITGL
ncbi:PREDICTED: DExH-box ATP-dependent RNA helicase DExH11 isoform X2 [Tarenaya hassleriana]|uniref:DExH-box ATP-dependent RNA helicase DExH11 isoform X2 n=1 Tax=Tarenaya hassleriana TaxID=28532 RepID=UPI00053C11F5|nr:PREDICTED: DExH-box ATP-dependent RNA helicase DExH11 isoform X2 [Tarenaya hassleriana]